MPTLIDAFMPVIPLYCFTYHAKIRQYSLPILFITPQVSTLPTLLLPATSVSPYFMHHYFCTAPVDLLFDDYYLSAISIRASFKQNYTSKSSLKYVLRICFPQYYSS
jgi:hypothetical protein